MRNSGEKGFSSESEIYPKIMLKSDRAPPIYPLEYSVKLNK